ncbi:hypothetical protein T459_08017 [Capsicum annuum]|uniref:Uncharacterized protein n=1 Tax=Capsicum annuum TaxID=4072 RepID=A0A2G2ZVC5_CAPAN|nr:hypothetical protein T459_08017 [Capsicum annuum]
MCTQANFRAGTHGGWGEPSPRKIKTYVEAEPADHAIVMADMCMAAFYAKQRNIHRAFRTYSNRYTNPARCTEDTELPVPFAKAISNIGVFNTELTVNIQDCCANISRGNLE